MARPLRIEYAGALYHVMSRCHGRRLIARDDVDRQARLDWLQRTVETYRWQLHAFVIMRHDEHLLLQTPEPNLSAGMQFLNGGYTASFNRRHRRAGRLLRGRFRSHLIEPAGPYLLAVSRYIHLHPVRAGVVSRPEQWRWSSYRGYQRSERALAWVTYERVLREFGRGPAQARQRYRQFVRAGSAQRLDSPFAAAVHGLVIGSGAFVSKIRPVLAGKASADSLSPPQRLSDRPSLDRIVSAVSAAFGAHPVSWVSRRRSDDPSRALAAYLARRRFGYPARQVADALGYSSHGGVAVAVRRFEAAGDNLHRKLRRLERTLTAD